MEEHFFKFSNLSNFNELVHGISNRHFGDMKFGHRSAQEIIKNRRLFLQQLNINLADVVVPQLAHSHRITEVTETQKSKGAFDSRSAIISTDGLITKQENLYLMLTTADCLPVLIYDPILKIVGNVHAGWRGIIDQIIPEVIKRFKIYGSDPKNLVAGIGPGICQKHFVVREDVLSLFLDNYPSATLVRNKDGYVDLIKAVLLDLTNMGLERNNIEFAGACTACQNGIYGSFRKEKESAPASAAIIGINLKK